MTSSFFGGGSEQNVVFYCTIKVYNVYMGCQPYPGVRVRVRIRSRPQDFKKSAPRSVPVPVFYFYYVFRSVYAP